MPYCTLTDLIERAGEAEIRQIADRDRDGVPDQYVIDAAIEDAGNLIDGFVGAKYTLPLPSVPAVVRPWAVSIARYYLHHNGAPDHVKDDYDEALAMLEKVSRGLFALPVAAGEDAPVSETGTVMGCHPPTVFTPQKLRGWK